MADANDKNVVGDAPTKEDLDKMTKQIESLSGQIKSLETERDDAKSKLSEADDALLQPDYLEFLNKKANPPVKDEGKSFDDMSDGEKKAFIAGTTRDVINEAAKDVLTRLSKVEQGLGYQSSALEVQKVIDGRADGTPHEDFWDYQKEMQKLADDNPKLSALRLYNIAKGEKQAVINKEREKEVPETERPGTSISTLQEKGLSKEKASEVAWNKSFGNKKSVTGE